MSDSSRITEFLYAYENIELNIDEKFALMIIIISSFNDATIYYWSMLDEDDLENSHAVTSFMREIAYVAKLDGRD
ncbi:hypothetical protein D3C78_1829920 [compost metagenome]